jgi:RHS repeat-associated protein
VASSVYFHDKNNDGCITTEADTNDPDSLEVIQRFWYYPRHGGQAFGMAMQGLRDWATEPGQWYRYNGKERDTVSGSYEYGARWYIDEIGRFAGVDPIADQFPWVSVYNYAENEPVGHIDLWGLQKVKRKENDGSFTLETVTVTAKRLETTSDEKSVRQHQSKENTFEEKSGRQSDAITTKTRPYARSLSVGWTFGGGFGLEVGRVRDEVGVSTWYFRSDARIGFGAGVSYNSTEIIPSPDNTFTVSQWDGFDNYTEFALGPIGYGWGENQQYWGEAGYPLLTPGAISGDLYKIRNIPINDPRELKGLRVSPSKWLLGTLKGAKVSAYRSWGQTWIPKKYLNR